MPRRVFVRPAVLAFLAAATVIPLWAGGPVVRAGTEPAASLVDASPGTTLGPYEMNAVAEGLRVHGFDVDRNPEGKQIGAIFVHNAEVFSDEDGWLQFANMFHPTTRDDIIAREVLLRPGDRWDTTIALETRRRLLDSSVTNLVVLVPIKADQPDTVHILVVTRDIWSLRLNTDFEFQGDVLSRLIIQPSENNLFGWRKRLSLVYDMTQGRIAMGPYYRDPNIAGTRWTLDANAQILRGRESGQTEGGTASLSIDHPLWAFSRKWAGGFNAGLSRGTARSFSGSALCLFDGDPLRCSTDPSTGVPVHYRFSSTIGGAYLSHQIGTRFINQFTLRYGFSDNRYSAFEQDFTGLAARDEQLRFPPPSGFFGLGWADDLDLSDRYRRLDPNFAVPAEIRERFIDAFLPRSERISSVGVSYSVFRPDFVTFRNVATLDFAEDIAIGPSLSLGFSRAMRVLGSHYDFWTSSAGAGWTVRVGQDGWAQVNAQASTRLQSGEFIDNSLSASVWAASPTLIDVFRLVVRADVDQLVRNRRVRFYTLGGDSGMRGYAIGAFRGQTVVRGNLELRTRGLALLGARLGGVVFWDVGHAAASFSDLVLHHDAGLGLRIVIPQLQRSVIRLDWAFATRNVFSTTGASITDAGWPGRFSAGFSQAF